MKIQLGGWQRLWIVASVAWMLVVGLYALYELEEGPAGRMLLIEMVPTGPPETFPEASVPKPGRVFADDEYPTTAPGDSPRTIKLTPVEEQLVVPRFLVAALLPPLVLWALVSVVVWAIRWVAAGFRSKGA